MRRVDWFDEVRDAIGYVRSQGTKQGSIDAADMFAPIIQKHLFAFTPRGEDPMAENFNVRDSERTGRPSRLVDGWGINVAPSKYGASVSVNHNDPDRLGWLRWGTRPHDIPLSRPATPGIFFWWGHPRRWVQKDNRPAGWRLFYQVSHPGMRYQQEGPIKKEMRGPGMAGAEGDFFAVAMSRAIDEIEPLLERKILPRVIMPLRESFRGKRWLKRAE